MKCSLEQVIISLLKKQPEDRTAPDIDQLLDFTKNTTFFASYFTEDNEYRDIPKKCCQFMTYEYEEKNQIIFNINEKGENFYVIISGQVGLYLTKTEIEKPQYDIDEMKLVKTLRNGECFGELALLNKSNRAATIICLEKTHFAILNKLYFQKICRQSENDKIYQEIVYLEQHQIFQDWYREDIKIFYDLCFRLQYRRNDVIYRIGDAVQKNENENNSSVDNKIYEESQSDSQLVKISILGSGEIFGEDELLNRLPCRLSQVTCTSSSGKLLQIENRDFQSQLMVKDSQSKLFIEAINNKKKLLSQNRVQCYEETQKEIEINSRQMLRKAVLAQKKSEITSEGSHRSIQILPELQLMTQNQKNEILEKEHESQAEKVREFLLSPKKQINQNFVQSIFGRSDNTSSTQNSFFKQNLLLQSHTLNSEFPSDKTFPFELTDNNQNGPISLENQLLSPFNKTVSPVFNKTSNLLNNQTILQKIVSTGQNLQNKGLLKQEGESINQKLEFDKHFSFEVAEETSNEINDGSMIQQIMSLSNRNLNSPQNTKLKQPSQHAPLHQSQTEQILVKTEIENDEISYNFKQNQANLLPILTQSGEPKDLVQSLNKSLDEDGRANPVFENFRRILKGFYYKKFQTVKYENLKSSLPKRIVRELDEIDQLQKKTQKDEDFTNLGRCLIEGTKVKQKKLPNQFIEKIHRRHQVYQEQFRQMNHISNKLNSISNQSISNDTLNQSLWHRRTKPQFGILNNDVLNKSGDSFKSIDKNPIQINSMELISASSLDSPKNEKQQKSTFQTLTNIYSTDALSDRVLRKTNIYAQNKSNQNIQIFDECMTTNLTPQITQNQVLKAKEFSIQECFQTQNSTFLITKCQFPQLKTDQLIANDSEFRNFNDDAKQGQTKSQGIINKGSTNQENHDSIIQNLDQYLKTQLKFRKTES